MQPIVSVIIPVYNSGDYLTVQVDSILVQTFKDFELLLVDDGSTDGVTPQLCDELAAKDSRIVVFHKKNGGVSDSRNYGLDRARGEFIAFADHDDYMYPDHLQTMVEEIEDLDLLICTYATGTREQINTYKRNDTRELVVVARNENEMRDGVTKMGYKNAPVWNQLFKKEIISKYNIRFQKIQYEDELFSYTYFIYVESFKRINFEGYYWIKNSNSQGSSHRYIAEMDWIIQMEYIYEKLITKYHIQDGNVLHAYNLRFAHRLAVLCMKGYYQDSARSWKERMGVWNSVRNDRWLKERIDPSKMRRNISLILKVAKYRLFYIADPFLFLYVRYCAK